MNLSGYNPRTGLAGLVMLFLWLNAAGQGSVKNPGQIKDTSKTESGRSHSSLFAGAGYGSNMIYLGSTISQNQPYSYGALSYGLSSELFVSLSSVHLPGVDPFLSFHIASLTYNHVFNSWFDISTGIYRYQIAPSLTDKLFSNFTYTEITLGFDWKLLYSKISAGGLFSGENQAYFQFRNSRYFKTADFFNGKANLSFDPYINLLLGTLIESKTTFETTVTISTPSRKWRKYRYNTTGSTTYSKRFGLMEVDLGLPIAFNTGRMTIEAEPGYLISAYDDPDFPGTSGFVFMLTGFFRIF